MGTKIKQQGPKSKRIAAKKPASRWPEGHWFATDEMPTREEMRGALLEGARALVYRARECVGDGEAIAAEPEPLAGNESELFFAARALAGLALMHEALTPRASKGGEP